MNPLIRLIPPPLVRFFARPYVAGDSLDRAMDVAADLLKKEKFLTTLDLLAEGIDTDQAVDQNLQTYLQMVDRAADDSRFVHDEERPTISLKPSSYTTAPLEAGGDGLRSKESIKQICGHAHEKQVQVTLDMESRHWTDFTLDCLDELVELGYDNVGCVIQTRLHRSPGDLSRLPKGVRVRLVIGIYREPEEVAMVSKPHMKERMLEFAEHLLDRGHYVEFATHDETFIRRFQEEVVGKGNVSAERYEVQMLYGVPRLKLLRELTAAGVRVRLYVPFAVGWSMAIAYLRRRLDEYPTMAFMVLRNMFHRG